MHVELCEDDVGEAYEHIRVYVFDAGAYYARGEMEAEGGDV